MTGQRQLDKKTGETLRVALRDSGWSIAGKKGLIPSPAQNSEQHQKEIDKIQVQF